EVAEARRSCPPTPPRQARATVPEGGVPGPRPPRRRWFEEVVWGGRRPGFGDMDVAEKPTWTYPRRPGRAPHTASTEAAPRKGRGRGTPPTPGISPAAQAQHRDTANADTFAPQMRPTKMEAGRKQPAPVRQHPSTLERGQKLNWVRTAYCAGSSPVSAFSPRV